MDLSEITQEGSVTNVIILREKLISKFLESKISNPFLSVYICPA
jgi:hypothetical protein